MLAVGVIEAVEVTDGVRVIVGVGVIVGSGVLDGVGVTITATACDPNRRVTNPKNPNANPNKMRRQPSRIRCRRKPKNGTSWAPRNRRQPSQSKSGIDSVRSATKMVMAESIVLSAVPPWEGF